MKLDKDYSSLNQELDNKLEDLFSYYTKLIKNSQDQSEKQTLLETFTKKADQIIQIKNNTQQQIIDKPNVNDTSDKSIFLEKSSFIQSSMTENSKEADFKYPPFVWTEMPVSSAKGPSPRRGHSALVADTFMIIFGGCYMESKCFNDVYFLDFRSQAWIEFKASGKIPSPREGHSAVLYGSTMWVYGGSSTEGYLNDLHSLNLETREWKQHFFSGPNGKGRAGHSAVIDGNSKMVVFGGYSDDGYANDILVANILLERYEVPVTTGTPPTPRENFSMTLVNNRIFIFGGFKEGGVLNDLFSIDLLSWTWKDVTAQGQIPPPRQGMASTRVGKKIFIVGGCDLRLQKCYSDTYIFDVDGLWWTKIENNKNDLTGRGDFSVIFYRGHIFTFGGCEMYKQCFNNIFLLNVNEQCPNKCSGKGQCRDIFGCACEQGYITHDCSLKIKCREDCQNHGMCHNNGKCGCYPGWTGIVCNTKIPCRGNCTDSMNGVCQLDARCKCNPGFAGEDCSEYTILGNDTDKTIDPFKELTELAARKIQNDRLDLVKSTYTTVGSTTFSQISMASRQNADEGEDKKDSETSENVKAEPSGYIVGPNHDVYYKTTDCKGNCNKKGVCLNSTCFCDQGFTNFDCSMTYKQYLEQGYKLKDMVMFMFITLATSAGATLIILLVKRSQRVSENFIDLSH